MMPATTNTAKKVECINPNTGGRMNIDAATYNLFTQAIHHTLQTSGAITYTQIVHGVKDYLLQQKIAFNGSVEWYTVTIKNAMQSNGTIEAFMEKGKKLHRLSKEK